MLLTAVSVWIAAYITAAEPEIFWFRVLMGSFAAGLIAAGGNIHNDIIDIAVDRINRPKKALPRGIVSVKTAMFAAVSLTIAGLVIGALLGPISFIITLSAFLVLYLYNRFLKMTVIWGNLAVSILTALCFIYGGVLVGEILFALIPAAFSFLLHFGREVVKDMEDFVGDRARPGKTFPQKYGNAASRRLAAAPLTILLIIVPLPYFAHLLNQYYLAVSIIGVEIPLLWIIHRLIFSRKQLNFMKISHLLKAGMVMGLLALALGG